MSTHGPAPVCDENEKIIGYVTIPDAYEHHQKPRYVFDPETMKLYEAELDDFCTFAYYREAKVTFAVIERVNEP